MIYAYSAYLLASIDTEIKLRNVCCCTVFAILRSPAEHENGLQYIDVIVRCCVLFLKYHICCRI